MVSGDDSLQGNEPGKAGRSGEDFHPKKSSVVSTCRDHARQPDGKESLDEGHGFSRVPMSLRLTQGDENYSDSPMMVLKGLDVVFDCAVNSRALTASATEVRFSRATGAAPSPGLGRVSSIRRCERACLATRRRVADRR